MPEGPIDQLDRGLQAIENDSVTDRLSSAEVRRRGGRRRVRRRLGVAGAVVVAAAVAVTGIGMQATGGILGTAPPPIAGGPSSTAPAPTQDAPASPAAPQLIEYGDGNGVEISSPDQVDRLTDAPESFREFVASIAVPDKVCNRVVITVKTIRTDGFATGSVGGCGGYAALWAQVDGQWQEIAGTQDIWTCTELEQYRVPASVAGDRCYRPGAPDLIEYTQP